MKAMGHQVSTPVTPCLWQRTTDCGRREISRAKPYTRSAISAESLANLLVSVTWAEDNKRCSYTLSHDVPGAPTLLAGQSLQHSEAATQSSATSSGACRLRRLRLGAAGQTAVPGGRSPSTFPAGDLQLCPGTSIEAVRGFVREATRQQPYVPPAASPSSPRPVRPPAWLTAAPS